MWQTLIVAVIVAAAAVHACTRYLPVAWRRQLVHILSQRGLNQARLAKLFKTEASCGDGCGSCSSAKPCAPTEASIAASDTPTRRVIRLHVQR